MRSDWIAESQDWSEEHKARINKDRKELETQLRALEKRMEELESEEQQVKDFLEGEEDAAWDSDLRRFGRRALAKLNSGREELKKRRGELLLRLGELERAEQQLRRLMEHEQYPKWLELKRERDKAMKEVERVEAEMKDLMTRMLRE
jgi:chromosome segregation ATPase